MLSLRDKEICVKANLSSDAEQINEDTFMNSMLSQVQLQSLSYFTKPEMFGVPLSLLVK